MKEDDGRSLWSLQAVVALVFTLIVLAISGSLIWFNHEQLTTLTVRDAQEDFRRISNNMRGEISGGLRIAGSVLDTVSLTVDPDLPQDQLAKNLLPILKDLERGLPATMGLFVARADGTQVSVQSLDEAIPPEVGHVPRESAFAFMITEPAPTGMVERWTVTDVDGNELKTTTPVPTSFDPRIRPWYRPAQTSSGAIMTAPYRFVNLPEAGITLARKSQQKQGAVLGVDMTLASLDLYLDRLRFPPELELIIFDEDGTFIAHPRGDALRTIQQANVESKLLKVTDLNNPLLTSMYEAFGRVQGRHAQSISFSSEGKEYFGWTERVGEGFDNLLVSLAIPYEAMMGPAEAIRFNLLAISAASVFVALLIVWLASRRLALPLRLAADDIRRVMRFEFGHAQRPHSRIGELRELARALDTLEVAISNFMRYVPTDLVRRIIGRTMTPELGGVRQPITVLFTDVAGFTPIAEALDPEEVMEKTSRYFSDVGSELLRTGATIDKFIGDSIMAFWNAPEPREDHVALACLGALRAARRLDRLNAEFVAEGGLPMRTRFGLHTGEAIVGNVGSTDRMNYTALGHTVNVASRIEKMGKRYGSSILVSEAVRDGAGEGYVFRFVDHVVPEGAHETLKIYELLGTKGDEELELLPKPERLQTLNAWEKALEAYEAGDYPNAMIILETLVAVAPGDMLFRLYLERCHKALEPAGDCSSA